MNAEYDASMGVRVSKSDTDGWIYQYWWENDYNWYKLEKASPKLLVDITNNLNRIPTNLHEELVSVINEVLKQKDNSPVLPAAKLVTGANALAASMVEQGVHLHTETQHPPELSAEQIAVAIKKLKEELLKREKEVEIKNIDEFLTKIDETWVMCGVLGIKMFDSLGEIRVPDAIAMALRVHGYYVMEAHLPDGEMFEMVLRYREGTNVVRSFSYKL